MARFDPAFEKVLGHEGGYVDHAADPGGATNYGISLRYLRDRGDLDGDGILDGDIDGDGDVDADDIRGLKLGDVKHLYHTGFWTPNRLNEVMSQPIATKIFDLCVNMGSRQGWKLVQRACNAAAMRFPDWDDIVDDGVVGPNTLRAVNTYSDGDEPDHLLETIREVQAQFYRDLVERKPSLEVFLAGWLNRAAA